MARKQKHPFIIPIGDWSDDGHGKCEYFHATAEKPFKDVCLAFKAARELFKTDGFTPEKVCDEYQDSQISDEHVEFLAKRGYEVDPENFYTEEMAELVVWFLNQGDPELNAELAQNKEKPPTLNNWQYCDAVGVETASNEGLGGFGYGFFE